MGCLISSSYHIFEWCLIYELFLYGTRCTQKSLSPFILSRQKSHCFYHFLLFSSCFFKKELLPHSNFLSKTPWPWHYFWTKKPLLHFFPQQKKQAPSLFSGKQVLAPSLSKPPSISINFVPSVTGHDTHNVYTETLSFSYLWGHLGSSNHLYGDGNIF